MNTLVEVTSAIEQADLPTPTKEEVAQIVEDAGLIYVNDNLPGITRHRVGKGFTYRLPDGTTLKDCKEIERIRKLAIPPAYTEVWICPLPEGHIQATGRDARGRKQYKYHRKWTEMTNGNKFGRMLAFGEALPRIRERVQADLQKRGLPREKVLATVVWFLEKSLIRVGNDEYAKHNNSFGLTTMRRRHVDVEGGQVRFRFVGKRGIKHEISVFDRKMARIVRKIQDLKGQELFTYLDEEGRKVDVTSTDVNAYLKEISGQDFTAKDFRTWSATVAAIEELSEKCGFETKREAQRAIRDALEQVSRQLGNTPAIARKSYVHPVVFERFGDGSLEAFLATPTVGGDADCDPEAVALALLRHLEEAEERQAA